MPLSRTSSPDSVAKLHEVRTQGSCAGFDPSLWDVEVSSDDPQTAAQAKSICRQCPVIAMCRNYAIEYKEYGIWGGLDTAERAAQRHGRAATVEARNKRVRAARLRDEGWTVQQIAEEIGVVRRTVFRWFNELEDLGGAA
jgi:WhiB family redox-sensing transcriptional regulator